MSSDRCFAYPSIFDSEICGSPVTGSVLHRAKKSDKGLDPETEELETRIVDSQRYHGSWQGYGAN